MQIKSNEVAFKYRKLCFMKTTAIAILVIVLCSNQAITQIRVQTQYYNNYGIILDDTINLPFKHNYKSFYIATKDDVLKAELIFKENIKNYLSAIVGIKKGKISRIVRKYKHYNRQYLGFIAKDDKKYILMIMLHFKNSRIEKEYFPDWEYKYFLGCGEFYENNTNIYIINMDDSNLEPTLN